MAIKNLTERRRLPRLGKIRTGIKVSNADGKEYPRAVDYFVCPPEVQAVYGEKPTSLRIMFPVDDESLFASQFYRCYSNSRGLLCKGDGVTAIRLVDAKTGEIAGRESTETQLKEIECKGKDCPLYGTRCTEVMNLQFLLPDVPGLGVWQIDTGSIYSIMNINSMVALIKSVLGHVRGVEMELVLEPMEVAPGGKKKIIRVLNLRINQTLKQLTGATQRQVDDDGVIHELPVPDDEVPELIIPENQEPPKTETEQSKIETNQPKPEETKPFPSGKLIQNIMELKKLLARHKIGTREALSILGVNSFNDLTDLDDAWEKIKQAKEGHINGESS